MGRQVHFYMLPDDCAGFTRSVQERDPDVQFVASESKTPDVSPCGRRVAHLQAKALGAWASPKYPEAPPARIGLMDRRDHWERFYTTNAPDAVSWFQPAPAMSWHFLGAAGLARHT